MNIFHQHDRSREIVIHELRKYVSICECGAATLRSRMCIVMLSVPGQTFCHDPSEDHNPCFDAIPRRVAQLVGLYLRCMWCKSPIRVRESDVRSAGRLVPFPRLILMSLMLRARLNSLFYLKLVSIGSSCQITYGSLRSKLCSMKWTIHAQASLRCSFGQRQVCLTSLAHCDFS